MFDLTWKFQGEHYWSERRSNLFAIHLCLAGWYCRKNLKWNNIHYNDSCNMFPFQASYWKHILLPSLPSSDCYLGVLSLKIKQVEIIISIRFSLRYCEDLWHLKFNALTLDIDNAKTIKYSVIIVYIMTPQGHLQNS